MTFDRALLIFAIVANSIVIYWVYKLTLKETEMDEPILRRPPAKFLKPFVKNEKKKPKINDDEKGWRKENDLE